MRLLEFTKRVICGEKGCEASKHEITPVFFLLEYMVPRIIGH